MAKKIDIDKISTKAPKWLDKEKCEKEMIKLQEKLASLQRKVIANKNDWILIILQWLDAAGKDGIIRNVIWWFTPVECDVIWRKAPSKEEASHDFLWRIHKQMPAKWSIRVFDRSYYEDILVPSVLWYIDKDIIKDRYETINQYEKYLEKNNIKVIKIFLSVSEKEQKDRLEERLLDPEKFRKHKDQDRDTFQLRDKYLEVYEKILEKCNSPKWHIIPADENRAKSYMIAKVLVEELESMKLEYPELQTQWWIDEFLDHMWEKSIEKVINKADSKDRKEVKELIKKISKNEKKKK